MIIRWFDAVTTYGEDCGSGWYWKAGDSDWIGPFPSEADARNDAATMGH